MTCGIWLLGIAAEPEILERRTRGAIRPGNDSLWLGAIRWALLQASCFHE